MLCALLARMPIALVGLALVLFVEEQTGSYAAAGAVAAAYSIGAGGSSPLRGRQVDRRGHGVLWRFAALEAVGLAAVVGLGLQGAPTVALCVAALVAGTGIPPISGVVRTLWPELLGDDPRRLSAAFALDAVLVELGFVLGPAITAAVVLVASPAAALALGATMVVVGTLGVVGSPAARAWQRPPAARGGRLIGALAAPGVRTIVLATVPIGFAFGTVEVALPAFADEEGDRALAGLLLGTWAAGSAFGGLWWGGRTTGRSLHARYVRAALGLPIGFAPLAFAPSIPFMALGLLAAGACIAPTLAAANQLVGTLAPAGAATEAYQWPTTALVLGIGVGNTASGAMVELGSWRLSLAVAALTATGAGAILLARRGSLTA